MSSIVQNSANKVWSVTKKTVNDSTDSVTNKAQKTWGAITGKTVADEAKRIFDNAKAEYDLEVAKHKVYVEQLNQELATQVSSINRYKLQIYQSDFARFISISRCVKNISVKGIPLEELFEQNLLIYKEDDTLLERSEVILIDFDNLSTSEIVKGLLSLGFFTRQKANESMAKAIEQKKAMEEQIEKMNGDRLKLKVVKEALDNVVNYFEEIMFSYSMLLDRFEYGIRTQRNRQVAMSPGAVDMKLDFKKLPIVHLEEFQAVFNLSIILKHMTQLSYVDDRGDIVQKDQEQLSKLAKLGQAQVHKAA